MITTTLYPVIVENSIAAFTNKSGVNIPFYLNRGNSFEDIQYCEVNICSIYGRILKKVSNVALGKSEKSEQLMVSISKMDYTFTAGTYYKFSIRIVNDGGASSWSIMTIGKCIAQPEISIIDFPEEKILYYQKNSYTGCLKYEDNVIGSAIDKPSQYRFSIIDENNNIINTSGWQYHNFTQDNLNNFEFYDYYTERTFTSNNIFILKYEVITENQYYTSVSRKLTSEQLYPMAEEEFGLKLTAAADNDNGCVNLIINALDKEKIFNGEYIISRYDEKNNWLDLFQFKMIANVGPVIKKRDLWVEQGIKYKYSIQKINSYGIRTERFLAETEKNNEIICNFEDIFLLDSEKILKIQFSPEVSSFKSVIQESKIETIGSQFPYVIRNGNINYKEFSLGGKISYLMDKDFLFMNDQDLNLLKDDSEIFDLKRTPTTNLTYENIQRERIFKLNVLNWLNNGKPKFFKSPTEGNYIIRLMNISLSPENALGRMIHSFSSTAYEVADNSYANLKKLSLLDFSLENSGTIQEDIVYRSKIIDSSNINSKENVLDSVINYFKITEAIPGTILTLYFQDSKDPVQFIIGSTGKYESGVFKQYITEMYINTPNNSTSFSATLHYRGIPNPDEDDFDKIKNLSSKYSFATLSGEECSNNTLINLLSQKSEGNIVPLKVKLYVENYDLINDYNSKVVINDNIIDIAGADLLELDKNIFGDNFDIDYPSNCIVATECYYKEILRMDGEQL